MLYFVKTGCQWRYLPSDFPPYSTVHSFYRRARISGLWDRITEHLVAPKTLAAFRRIKWAGGDKLGMMQLDYRRRSALEAHPEKALPGAEQAVAESDKFTGYFFNQKNKDGWSKGVAFSNHLGYNIDNWQDFQADILRRARLYPVGPEYTVGEWRRHNQSVVVYGPKRNPMSIKVVWQIENGKPRLITAYPDQEGRQ